MRSRLKPEAVGLASVGQRRVPGLRREEVAQLAGVGLAWYTWLEQGRDVNVSSDVLERLHAALGLSAAEREHLFALAHSRPPPHVGFDGGTVSPSSAALLGQMAGAAYVANTRWDVLAWNTAAAELFTDLVDAVGRQPNMMRLLFTSPNLRALHVDWETDARVTVEKFRMDFWRHRTEESFIELVNELQAASSEFRSWWATPFVHSIGDGVKAFRGQDGQPIEYDYSVLALSENQSQRLVVFMPRTDTQRGHGVIYAAPPTDQGSA